MALVAFGCAVVICHKIAPMAHTTRFSVASVPQRHHPVLPAPLEHGDSLARLEAHSIPANAFPHGPLSAQPPRRPLRAPHARPTPHSPPSATLRAGVVPASLAACAAALASVFLIRSRQDHRSRTLTRPAVAMTAVTGSHDRNAAEAPSDSQGPSFLNRVHLPRRQTLLAAPLIVTGMGASARAAPAAPGQAASLAGAFPGLPGKFDLEAAVTPGPNPVIFNPGLSRAFSNREKQLFYPDWLEGTWDVTAEFAGFSAPLGNRFISPAVPGLRKCSILRIADVGASPVRYRARYVRSAAEGGVVADRVFNAASAVGAFLGRPGAVQRVQYDPAANPTRYSVVYTTPRRATDYDQTPDLWKAELFLNNRSAATRPLPDGREAFLFAEAERQVLQAARQGGVYDFVLAARLEPVDAGKTQIEGFQRVAAFLQPQDALYFEAGGRAVAVYDYRLRLTRSSGGL